MQLSAYLPTIISIYGNSQGQSGLSVNLVEEAFQVFIRMGIETIQAENPGEEPNDGRWSRSFFERLGEVTSDE